MLKKSWIFILCLILVSALVVSCGGDDDNTDGDIDGDTTIDGDTEVADGDENLDGDEAIDGDEEFVFEQCTAEAGHFCFAIDSGDLQGNYDYLYRSEIPSSGCKVDGTNYSAEFYQSLESWSKIAVKIENYAGVAEYSLPTDQLSVTLNLVTDLTKNYLALNPCKVKLISETRGTVECTLYDLDDAGIYFNLLGSFNCAE